MTGMNEKGQVAVIPPVTAGTRGRDGRWLPGKSANPGGRIASSEEFKRIRQLYRDNSEEAVREAQRLMRESDDDRVRLAACQLTMERAWGKAPDSYAPETDPDERRLSLDLTNPVIRKMAVDLIEANRRAATGKGSE